jgi:hypothetical protein
MGFQKRLRRGARFAAPDGHAILRRAVVDGANPG